MGGMDSPVVDDMESPEVVVSAEVEEAAVALDKVPLEAEAFRLAP